MPRRPATDRTDALASANPLTTRILKFLDEHQARAYRARDIADALGEGRVKVVRTTLCNLAVEGRVARFSAGLFGASASAGSIRRKLAVQAAEQEPVRALLRQRTRERRRLGEEIARRLDVDKALVLLFKAGKQAFPQRKLPALLELLQNLPPRRKPGRPKHSYVAGVLSARIVKFLQGRARRAYRAPEIAEALGVRERVLVVRALLRQLSEAGRIVRVARGLFQGKGKL
jgi:hypothetical protein